MLIQLNFFITYFPLILSALSIGAVFAATLIYKETTSEKDFNREIEVGKTDNGYLVKTVYGTKDEMTIYTDPSFSVVKLKCYNPDNGTDITAERYGNAISVSGRFNNKRHDDKLKIDDLPWCQEVSLGLKSFIVSDKKTTQFWLMNPENFKATKFELNKEKTETIDVGDQKIESVHVKMTFTGFMKPFWSGNMWFRKSDGTYIFSKFTTGPGKPVTTTSLLEEK